MNTIKHSRHNSILVGVTLAIFLGSCVFMANGAERVVRMSEQSTPAEGSSKAGTRVSAKVRISNSAEAAVGEPFENATKALWRLKDDNVFLVYTVEEIDDLLKVNRTETLQAASEAARAELATTKADLLNSISQTVGKQLTPEQLEQIKSAVAADVAKQLREEFAAEVNSLRTELGNLRAQVQRDLGAPRR